MSAFRTDYFPPSNRRRCVKGRSSYTESSDLYLSATASQDQNSNGFSQNEDSYIDSVQSDDGEEEDITIDLSAFLNDNPLLAQAAFETTSENNVAPAESSSQFRVTDCKVDPSETPKPEVTDTLLSVNLNSDTFVGSSVINDNTVVPHDVDSHTFTHNNAKENCLSSEKILTNVTNSEPTQSIILNGKKTVISPTKKFSRALGLSNPLKKYKNFMKSKDLNKVNEKVFGKYPVVKCEKLDIENFVKNNKIKIRNWPLIQTENHKSNFANKGAIKKKVNSNKSNLKPKFMKKPINFNKYLIVSNKNSPNQTINNALGVQPDVSKPIIIKTDSWKPGVANASPRVQTFFRPLTKTSLSTSKNVVCDLLKFNDKTLSLNVISSPEKRCDIRANTIATNISKFFNTPKSYPLIAPKPPPNIHSITTTKPVIETLSTPAVDNFTVIEPYVDDPTSPQKPKSILTVPLEVVPSPQKQNSVINSNIIPGVDIITNVDNSLKLLKTEKSVFLNSRIKKIITPTKIKKDAPVIKKEVVPRKSNQENLLKEVAPKVPVVLKVKDASPEENPSVLKAKNMVVDAMQSAFSSTQSKKNIKARPIKKPAFDLPPGNSLLGSSAYSSILNDNILNGFSENDFEDVSLFEDDSFTDSIPEMSPPEKPIPNKVNMIMENSTPTPRSIKKAREKGKYKRKKSLESSLETKSTLSVSECENEGKLENDKKTISTPENNTESIKLSTVKKDFEKSINNSVPSNNFIESINKDFETKHDSSLLFSNFENHISESQDNINFNKPLSPKMVEQTDISLSPFNESVQNGNSPIKKCKENDNLTKQETSTRTLRDRKCSSTEVKNFNNSPKHNSLEKKSLEKKSPEKNSPEKNKIKASINSKLKIQLKSPKNSSKVKLKKKSCKPEDIIQEINTITRGHSVSKRGLSKSKKFDSEKDIKNSDHSNINIQDNSESNLSLSNQQSLHPLTKRRKTLKVSIKRSNRKNSSCSKIPLNTLTDVVENSNISNSVSESNLSLHSSFREAKDEKMETLEKEENSAVNSSPIPDCNMENSNDKLDQKEQMPDAPDLMVNSETPLIEDNNTNSDVNYTISDKILLTENEDNLKELSNDVNHNEDESNKNEKPNFSLVSDIKNSENDSECCEGLHTENNVAIDVSSFKNSKDLNSENDSESLIKETNSAVIEISTSLIQNSKETVLSEGDSVEHESNVFSDIDNNSNVYNENLHNICDVDLNSTVNQDSKNIFEEAENTFEEIVVNPAISADNEVVKRDPVPEETVIEEVITVPEETVIEEVITTEICGERYVETEICDDSELISNNTDVKNKEDNSNPVPFIKFPEKSTSSSKNNAIIEENIVDNSDMPINENKNDENHIDSRICPQFKKELKTSIYLPDDSTPVEKETLIVEESDNTSDKFTDNLGSFSDELSKKSENFTENVKSPLLKSVEDKIAISEETINLIDGVSDKLVVDNYNKNIDDSQVSDVSSNISEKEIIPFEEHSPQENQTSNCQINEVSEINLNNTCSVEKEIITCEKNKNQNLSSQVTDISPNASCENFEVQSDDDYANPMNSAETSVISETEILSSEKCSIHKNKKLSSTAKSKKCPKIRISFKKPDGDSPDSLKNWFVSESDQTDIKSSVSRYVFETKSDDISIINSDKTPILDIPKSIDKISDSEDLCAEGTEVTSKHDLLPDADTSNAVLPEKTSNSLDNSNVNTSDINLLSDEKVLTKADESLSESQPAKKIDSLSSEETSLPDKISSDENNECASENLPSADHKESSNALPSEKEKNDHVDSIVIKEEPMDFEENSESEPKTNSYSSEEKSLNAEPSQNKRKRGRPRKSIEYCNTSLDFDKNEMILKREETTTTTVLPEVKMEAVTPKREVISTPAHHSTARKRKSSQTPASTPSSARRKNYDPELVCVPFSMGWMREHVIRATGKDNKRQSDIYYFSPEGTKLRSMPDILSYLSKHSHIKLTAENFTFAKELIYREPFEIERDAKQAFKKLCTTPTPKKSPKTPGKALLSPADSSSDVLLVESKKKMTVKRKSSLLNKTELLSEVKNTKSNSANISKNSRRLSIESSTKKTEDKALRPTRKIVKKIPFDNSIESQPPKKAKSNIIVTRNSSANIKINLKRESKEPLILKIPVKPPFHVTHEKELQNSEPSVEGEKNELKSSDASDKTPSKTKSKKDITVNKPLSMPVKTSSSSENAGSLLSRTNIKSPVIQNRLKVKLGPRKGDPTSLTLLHKPCTKYCHFSYIRLPSVQCSVCLCLFHPECIPFKPTGLTKYVCVPCVAAQMCFHNEMSEDLVFPVDFNFEMLHPTILLNILIDPVFDATYNKFFSPVASSVNYARPQRPLQPYMAYYADKNSFKPLRASTPTTQKSAVWYPINTQNVSNSNFQPLSNPNFQPLSNPVPIQKAPNVNIQNIYAVNHSGSSNVPIKIVNPRGSLPLLQNFSNAFFVQNQASPCSSVNIQNSFNHSATNTKAPLGTFTNTSSSNVQTLFVRKLPNNQQISGLISSGNVNSISDHSKNVSVLQTMLQSNTDLSNKSIKLIKFNDYSTLKISGNNFSIPSRLSVNITSENKSDSPKEISSTVPSESENNKRKMEDNSDTVTKKTKLNESIESNNFTQDSPSPHKISNVRSFSELTGCWNMNKFAQIYECLNFIFKFLNVSDLLRASLVCKSWNHLAAQKLLWERVSFSGIIIKDWVLCCKTLMKHGTKCIDFRGLKNQISDDDWKTFLENIQRLMDVEELIFAKVPPYVIKKIADNLPQLRKLTCLCLTSIFTEPGIWSTPCEFELATLRCLGRLEALKISSLGGIHLKDNQLSLLPYLPNLTYLVLSGFKFSSCMNLECLSQMQQLITLELGDCVEIEPQIYSLLSHLTNLENLCLQNGGDINDKKLSEALLKMNNLKSLELMNFKLSCHLPDSLKKMDTLHHFILWPDSRIMGEQVHFNSFKAATSCPNLKRLIWGILTDDDAVPNTLELRDSEQNKSEVRKMSFQELFLSLVKHNPGVKVELKCLPRTGWSEFCSTRNYI